MPRPTNKRKQVEEGSGDETLPAPKKTRRTRNTVKFAETVQAVSFNEYSKPKSILQTRSAPFPTTPESPDAIQSPSSESFIEPEGDEFDTEAANMMRKLAAAAMQLVEDAPKGRLEQRLEQDLKAAQRELASTKMDLENVRFYEKMLLQVRDLADANERAKTAHAELQEALLANGRLENKFRTLEGRSKSADEEVEKLQRQVITLREEKAEMEKLLRQKTAKERAEVDDGFASRT
ncbi:MAG: hypothetical protein Q9161_001222 [Pseudevernia consocians]